MAGDQFDPDIPNVVQGEVTSVRLIDKVQPDPPNVANLVVDPRTGFDIEITWEVTGNYAAAFLNAGTGNWNVQAYAESIGAGFEGLIAQDNTVPPNALNPPFTYSVRLSVDPNNPLLAEHDPGAGTGLYKLAVAVFLNSILPGPGNDMIGFREGPVFMVEDVR